MNLPELIETFGTEDKCIAFLEELRWPEGVTCPKCESSDIGRITTRKTFQCKACEYQFSVRVGTVLQDSKLPLWKWFLCLYLMIESKKGISASQISRTLGVTTKTGWYLCHRVRAAMVPDDEKLDGTIEMDETYLGGYAYGKGKGYKGNKSLILGAIERGGDVRLKAVVSRDGAAFGKFARQYFAPNTERVITDEWPAYSTVREFKDHDTSHHTVNHRQEEWVRGDVHTNSVESVWSLLKRSVIGSYHQLSKKHLPAYLDEFTWRFNNRENPYLFRDALIRLCQSEVLGYQGLIAS